MDDQTILITIIVSLILVLLLCCMTNNYIKIKILNDKFGVMQEELTTIRMNNVLKHYDTVKKQCIE